MTNNTAKISSATENMAMNSKNSNRMADFFKKRNVEEERLHRKKNLVAAFRLFGKFGFDEGLAGHITARDPEHLEQFWVNPLGVSFKQMTVSDLILVDHKGTVVQGDGLLNRAAFTIHAEVHKARPDVVCAAHTHAVYGKAWSSLGKALDPISQDACAFYNDHAVFEEFTGVVVDNSEGVAIAKGLGNNKAAILANHGLITVGTTVESAAWWYITMERSCQTQLAAEAAGTPKLIADDIAKLTYETVGTELAGRASFSPLFDVISAEQGEMFE